MDDGRRGPGAILEARNVTFRRGRSVVLEDISLAVQPSDRVAILGPSGSGKTTFLRLLAGLERPSEGAVQVRTVGNRSAAKRPAVGLVFQDLALFPHMSVSQNVAFALLRHNLPASERIARATYFLDRAGIGHLAGRFPHTISGGEQRRVALVRTLASEPSVALLDEPFASLDRHLIWSFSDWLDEVQSASSIPLVLVTHHVEWALRWARHILLLHEGRVVDSGPPEHMYSYPISLFSAEFLGQCNVIGESHIHSIEPVSGCSHTVSVVVRGLGRALAHCRSSLGVRHALLVRPEDIEVDSDRKEGHWFPSSIKRLSSSGNRDHLRIALDVGLSLDIETPRLAVERRTVGSRIYLKWPPRHAVVLPLEG